MRLIWLFFPFLSAMAGPTLLSRYDELMSKYPPAVAIPKKCVAPKILENPQSRRYRTTLASQLKENPPAPNFCGKFLVMQEPITGGGVLFLADCDTGQIRTVRNHYAFLKPYSKPGSCVLIEHEPNAKQADNDFFETVYGAPQLFRWKGNALTEMADPVWKGRPREN